MVGHAVQCTRAGAKVKALQEVLQCPVIQTSGGTAFIEGLEDRTFPYLFSSVGNENRQQSDLVIAMRHRAGEPMHYGRNHHFRVNDENRKWIYIELESDCDRPESPDRCNRWSATCAPSCRS